MPISNGLSKVATKWRKTTAIRGKKVTCSKDGATEAESIVAEKGHFAVYTCDGRRFEVPLAYLDYDFFGELLRMSEEEFGRPVNGPIKLVCDGVFMEHLLCYIVKNKHIFEEVERSLVAMSGSCTTSFDHFF